MGSKKNCKSLLDHNGLPKEPLCVCDSKDISFASFRHTSRPSPLLVDVTLVHQSHVGVLRPHHFSMAPLNKAMSAFSSPQFRSPPEGKLRDGQTQDKPRWVIEQGCNKAGLQRNGVRQAPSGSRATWIWSVQGAWLRSKRLDTRNVIPLYWLINRISHNGLW